MGDRWQTILGRYELQIYKIDIKNILDIFRQRTEAGAGQFGEVWQKIILTLKRCAFLI